MAVVPAVCRHTSAAGQRSPTTSPLKCFLPSPLLPACHCADKFLAPTAAKRVHIYQSPVTGTYDAVNSIWRGSLGGEGSTGACFSLLARQCAPSFRISHDLP